MVIILIYTSPKISKRLQILKRINITFNTPLCFCLVCSKTIPSLSWFLFCDFWLFQANMCRLSLWHLSSQTSYWSPGVKINIKAGLSHDRLHICSNLFSSVFSSVSFLFRFLTRPLQLFLLWNCCQDESILLFPLSYLFKSWEVIGWHVNTWVVFVIKSPCVCKWNTKTGWSNSNLG